MAPCWRMGSLGSVGIILGWYFLGRCIVSRFGVGVFGVVVAFFVPDEGGGVNISGGGSIHGGGYVLLKVDTGHYLVRRLL